MAVLLAPFFAEGFFEATNDFAGVLVAALDAIARIVEEVCAVRATGCTDTRGLAAIAGCKATGCVCGETKVREEFFCTLVATVAPEGTRRALETI